MKMKRTLSFLLVLTMLLSLCVPVASAAGTDYVAGITVSKVDDAKLSVSVDVGPSGESAKIQAVQSFVLAYDMDVLKLVYSDGFEYTDTLTESPVEMPDATYEVYRDPSRNTWTTKVYVYAKDNIGYMIVQPANGKGSTLTEAVSLAKLYMGFKTGKTIADVNPKTIRFATAEELEGMSEDKALKLNDGINKDSYVWNAGDDSSTLKLTPAVKADGFVFAEIPKEMPVCAAPEGITAVYGQKLSEIALTNAEGNTAGTWSWDAASTTIDGIGTKTYKATFTPDDAVTYETVSGVDVTVTVSAKTLTDVAVSAIDDQVYTGKAVEPAVTVTGGGKTLKKGTDYTVSYANNTAVGTALVTVKAVEGGNYAFADVEKNFNIVSAPSTIAITGDISKTYDGTAVAAPAASVTGSQGEVTYAYYTDAACTAKIDAPKNVGTYYVKATVAADANFGSASAVKSFEIKAAAYTYAYAGANTATIGTSYPAASAVSASGVAGEAVAGQLTWYTNAACTTPAQGKFSSVGTQELFWKFTPAASETNYKADAVTGSVVFTVSALPAQAFAAGFDAAVAKTYGDAAYTRAASLTTGTGAITYSSSNTSVAVVNAATGEVTVKGAGSAVITATAAEVASTWAESSVSYTLTVAPKAVTVTVDAAEREYGKANPTFTAAVTAGALVNGDTIADLGLGLTTAATAASNAGTYDVVGDGTYNANYAVTVNGSGKLTVAKTAWTGAVTASGSAKYGASGSVALADLIAAGASAAIESTTDAKNVLDGAAVLSGSALTYKFASDAEVGAKVQVVVKVSGATNYKDYTMTVTLEVIDKLLPVVSANDLTVTYTGAAVANSAITGTANVAGTWAFKAEQALTNVADSGVKTVVFTPADTANYKAVEDTITLTIKKADPTGAPAYTKIEAAEKTLADAALTVGTIAPAGTIAWVDAEGNVLADTTVVEKNTDYKWVFTPADTDNYNTLTGEIELYTVRSSGGGGSSASVGKIEASKAENGKVELSKDKAKEGDKVTVTVTPDEGYILSGVKIYDEKGNEIEVTVNEKGEYTFVMPEGAVSVKATFVPVEMPFVDVAENAWYYSSVAYAYSNGLMQGTAADKFSPDVTTTRAMIVTILYNLEGKPAASTSKFEDVAAGAWYAAPVAWAAEKGIVTGYDADTFGPQDAITREQLATILYRYAQFKGYDTDAKKSDAFLAFKDADTISAYSYEAMQWAVETGLINGMTADTLAPAGNATRAQAAKILMMFCQNILK